MTHVRCELLASRVCSGSVHNWCLRRRKWRRKKKKKKGDGGGGEQREDGGKRSKWWRRNTMHMRGKRRSWCPTWKMKKRWRNTNRFKNDEREGGEGETDRHTKRHCESRLGRGGGGESYSHHTESTGCTPSPPNPESNFLAHSAKQRATELSQNLILVGPLIILVYQNRKS